MSNKFNYITEETIKNLVDRFYSKIRKDPDLSKIFERAIGGNSNELWQQHLNKMYNFWSSLMLASGRYNGTPMQKHKNLPIFDMSLFDRWLKLFEDAVREIHTGDVIDQYKTKSCLIAESLKLGIYKTHHSI